MMIMYKIDPFDNIRGKTLILMIYGPRAVPVISVLEHLNQDLDDQELIHGKPGPRLDLLIFK